MTTWADEYLTMLDDCEKREERLTDWERGFVDSLRRQIEQGAPAQRKAGRDAGQLLGARHGAWVVLANAELTGRAARRGPG